MLADDSAFYADNDAEANHEDAVMAHHYGLTNNVEKTTAHNGRL